MTLGTFNQGHDSPCIYRWSIILFGWFLKHGYPKIYTLYHGIYWCITVYYYVDPCLEVQMVGINFRRHAMNLNDRCEMASLIIFKSVPFFYSSWGSTQHMNISTIDSHPTFRIEVNVVSEKDAKNPCKTGQNGVQMFWQRTQPLKKMVSELPIQAMEIP